jgi:flagellar basal-body rod protein FlgF
VTEMGDPVMGQRGEIKLASGDVQVSPDGAIQVNGQRADKIKVMEFLDSSPPQKSENGLFAGDKPKPSKDVIIETGYVEESNVNALTEMVKMIQSMRMYESAQKLIQAFDHMTELAVQDVGKLG